MLLFVLSGVGIHRSNFLKLGVKICTYNHHCSAPSSRALLVGLAPPTLLGLRSRHCHGINYTHPPLRSVYFSFTNRIGKIARSNLWHQQKVLDDIAASTCYNSSDFRPD